jgi:hypothetical protein
MIMPVFCMSMFILLRETKFGALLPLRVSMSGFLEQHLYCCRNQRLLIGIAKSVILKFTVAKNNDLF